METSPEVTFEDFAKIDLRAGTIIVAEEVPKSKKLVRLEVDFGDEVGIRQIVAGIRSSIDDVRDLIGFQAMFVVNIAPLEMMGLKSHGMIIAANRSTITSLPTGCHCLHPPQNNMQGK